MLRRILLISGIAIVSFLLTLGILNIAYKTQTDLCDNIEGTQAEVPQKALPLNGNCYFPPPEAYSGRAIVPFFSTELEENRLKELGETICKSQGREYVDTHTSVHEDTNLRYAICGQALDPQ